MYSSLPTFVLGFHGCDKSAGEKILSGKDRLRATKKAYHWLGQGCYFWENNPSRARDYAEQLKKNPRQDGPHVNDPFALGAIIDLGYCFNLLDSTCLQILKRMHKECMEFLIATDIEIPKNETLGKGQGFLLRKLDCAVIEFMHKYVRRKRMKEYDSLRGVFPEGEPVYEGAGIRDKDHIQICVRNPNCIKGYFRVLDPVPNYSIP